MKIIRYTQILQIHTTKPVNEIYLQSGGSLWDNISAVQPSTASYIGAENGA